MLWTIVNPLLSSFLTAAAAIVLCNRLMLLVRCAVVARQQPHLSHRCPLPLMSCISLLLLCCCRCQHCHCFSATDTPLLHTLIRCIVPAANILHCIPPLLLVCCCALALVHCCFAVSSHSIIKLPPLLPQQFWGGQVGGFEGWEQHRREGLQ